MEVPLTTPDTDADREAPTEPDIRGGADSLIGAP